MDVDHVMIYDAPCSLPGASFVHLPIYGLEDLAFVPKGEAGAVIQSRPRQVAAQYQWRRSFLHAFRHVRHLRAAGERAPDARHCPRARSRCAMVWAACSPPPAHHHAERAALTGRSHIPVTPNRRADCNRQGHPKADKAVSEGNHARQGRVRDVGSASDAGCAV